MDAALQRCRSRCRRLHGRDPMFVVQVPGRVNLIGEHVDYNAGIVLPMAIDRYLAMAVCTGHGAGLRVSTELATRAAVIPLTGDLPPALPRWARLIGAVVHLAPPDVRPRGGLEVAIASDIPAGAGLSSSAALTVATATMLEHLAGRALDTPALCRDAERTAVGVPCGLMDPLACARGRAGCALRFDCATGDMQCLPLWDEALSLLVIDSGVERALADSAYARRRAECTAAAAAVGAASLRGVDAEGLKDIAARLDDTHMRRARHVISEIARTARAAEWLTARRYADFGGAMVDSHRSLRDDFEVSCAAADTLVDALVDHPGVLGARMTGAGFGGCVIALVHGAAVDAVRQAALAAATAAGHPPAGAWTVRAVDGARVHA